jgi:hypothetical protein
MKHSYFSWAATMPLVLATCVSLSSCSAQRATTTTTTEVRDADSDRGMYSGSATDTTEVRRSETTTEVHDTGSEGGLFQIVGDIIALPFRAVGALLSAIF